MDDYVILITGTLGYFVIMLGLHYLRNKLIRSKTLSGLHKDFGKY